MLKNLLRTYVFLLIQFNHHKQILKTTTFNISKLDKLDNLLYFCYPPMSLDLELSFLNIYLELSKNIDS